MYKRELNLLNLLEKKSFFLFGPRATGKTTLIKESVENAKIIDLLNTKTYSSLIRNPNLLEEVISDEKQIIVIDEIQRIPELLNEVHRLIQSKKITFLLTGSSARKLKHGGANLLAGRAWEARLFPLTSTEIDNFDLIKMLNVGGIPDVYDSEDPEEELVAYVDTYLREEIKAEAVTRNVSAFIEFLDAIAISNGQEISYESFSKDLQISPGTLKNYLQILEDTLIGFRLKGYAKTKKRKAIQRAKHYLFDLGVTRFLAKQSKIIKGSKAYGDAFEHFIILETRAYLSYRRKRLDMCYWRTTSQMEVDLLIGDDVAIEIKASENPNTNQLKGLLALNEENIFKKLFLVCNTEMDRLTKDGIKIVSWKSFLEDLWDDKII